jgi:AcrR family transcriptional regulator
MSDSEGFSPAPGRGQYDRRQSREQRLAEQKERLVEATARAFALHAAPSVAHVIEIAGVGRGTFYEYFDDVEHARAAAVSLMQRRLEQALRAAEARSRTPVERFRALAQAWLDFADAEPAGTLVALRFEAGETRTALSPIGGVLEASITRSLAALAHAGMIRGARDPLHTLAAAAGAEAYARRVAGHALGAETAVAAVPRLDRAAVERALVDVQVRLLR